jgi:hypothetical protein
MAYLPKAIVAAGGVEKGADAESSAPAMPVEAIVR